MKKIITLFFIFICFNSFSQVALKIINFRPTGELGMLMKPTITGELFYKDFDDESKVIPRFGLGFIKCTPRLDTFLVQGLIVSQTTTVSPGYITYQKYNLFYLYGGMDYKISIYKGFSLYPGIDVNLGGTIVEYQSQYPTISSEDYSGGSVYLGIRTRAGAEYEIKEEKAAIFIEATRNMNLIPQEAFFAYNDYGIGFRYKF
jgi:hypothetical protein